MRLHRKDWLLSSKSWLCLAFEHMRWFSRGLGADGQGLNFKPVIRGPASGSEGGGGQRQPWHPPISFSGMQGKWVMSLKSQESVLVWVTVLGSKGPKSNLKKFKLRENLLVHWEAWGGPCWAMGSAGVARAVSLSSCLTRFSSRWPSSLGAWWPRRLQLPSFPFSACGRECSHWSPSTDCQWVSEVSVACLASTLPLCQTSRMRPLLEVGGSARKPAKGHGEGMSPKRNRGRGMAVELGHRPPDEDGAARPSCLWVGHVSWCDSYSPKIIFVQLLPISPTPFKFLPGAPPQ